MTGSWGHFTNLKTGAEGNLFSAGGALGWEVSGGASHAIYSSLGDVKGLAVAANFQVGPFTASLSFTHNEQTGWHLAAVPVGASLPATPADASVSATGTRLYGCTIKR